jgi:hypothetical protein
MSDLVILDQTDTPENLGVEFGHSADGFPVARIGDITLAMLPLKEGGGFLASAWRNARPLGELTRADFYSHEGRLDDEAAFRARAMETAEHKRDLTCLGRVQARMNCNTPWGASQIATIYADGVVSHMTAGHGGFKLSAERNAQVHPALRSDGGWYEEDCAWASVAITFPDLFTGFEKRCAEATLRDWEPDAWEAISGTSLGPGQSRVKDRRTFEAEHADDWIGISALRSDFHPGMTEVIATRGGRHDRKAEEQRFLVPSAEYQPGSFGFVIDEDRHRPYDGPSCFAGRNAGRTAA